MGKIKRKLKQLIVLDKKINELPTLSPVENELFEAEQRFEATFHSNKLEGNKLTKEEAKKAVL